MGHAPKLPNPFRQYINQNSISTGLNFSLVCRSPPWCRLADTAQYRQSRTYLRNFNCNAPGNMSLAPFVVANFNLLQSKIPNKLLHHGPLLSNPDSFTQTPINSKLLTALQILSAATIICTLLLTSTTNSTPLAPSPNPTNYVLDPKSVSNTLP